MKKGIGGGIGLSRFATAPGASANLFLGKKNADGEDFFMIRTDRLDEVIKRNGLVAGLEAFLELPFGVGLFGQFFRLLKTVAIIPSHPSPGGRIARVQEDGPKDGFPSIGEGANGLMNFLLGGIGTDFEGSV